MARGFQTFVTAAASAGLLGACAHAGGPGLATAASPAGFGALGEDLPASARADAGPAAGLDQLGALGEDLTAAPDRHGKAARPAAVQVASIDTPVSRLCARAAAKAVVDRDLPGLTTRPEFPFFKHMSLRQLQAASGGKMSRATLQQVSADLDALPAGALVGAMAADTKAPARRRRRTLIVRIASILP